MARVERQKRKNAKRRVKKKGKMVVEEKSPNKEGVLGPAGFGP
jgi:hypothetical protein